MSVPFSSPSPPLQCHRGNLHEHNLIYKLILPYDTPSPLPPLSKKTKQNKSKMPNWKSNLPSSFPPPSILCFEFESELKLDQMKRGAVLVEMVSKCYLLRVYVCTYTYYRFAPGNKEKKKKMMKIWPIADRLLITFWYCPVVGPGGMQL